LTSTARAMSPPRPLRTRHRTSSKPTDPGCLRRADPGDLTNRDRRSRLPRLRITQQHPQGYSCGRQAVFLSSGVSGGSLGLAVAATSDRPADAAGQLSAPDALSAAAIGLLVRDDIAALTGIHFPTLDRTDSRGWHDRAALMESIWEQQAPKLRQRFIGGGHPRTGNMIFNSTSVGTSCRVLVSQIHLDNTTPRAATRPLQFRDDPPCRSGAAVAPATFDLLTDYAYQPAADSGDQCVHQLSMATAARGVGPLHLHHPVGRRRSLQQLHPAATHRRRLRRRHRAWHTNRSRPTLAGPGTQSQRRSFDRPTDTPSGESDGPCVRDSDHRAAEKQLRLRHHTQHQQTHHRNPGTPTWKGSRSRSNRHLHTAATGSPTHRPHRAVRTGRLRPMHPTHQAEPQRDPPSSHPRRTRHHTHHHSPTRLDTVPRQPHHPEYRPRQAIQRPMPESTHYRGLRSRVRPPRRPTRRNP
jgi:hypothetical protein